MSVTEELHRLGGVAQRRTLVRLTSRRRVERAVEAGDVLQVRGRCVLPTAHDAVVRAVTVHGVVSHRSAAAWWGWELKEQPPHPEVTVRRGTRVRGSRLGLHVTSLPDDDVHDDLVTTPARTLTDCLRVLPRDEAQAIADSALRHGAVTPSGLRALAAGVHGPGAPAVRRVARDARGEAANPFESVLRVRAIEAGLDVVPQLVVRHGHDQVRPDLVDVERRIVLEADSFAWHGSRGALRRDTRRYNWLVRHGWRVLRLSYEDVMGEPAYVVELLRAMRAPVHTEVAVRGARRAS